VVFGAQFQHALLLSEGAFADAEQSTGVLIDAGP